MILSMGVSLMKREFWQKKISSGFCCPQRIKTSPQNILNKEVLIAGTGYKVIGVLEEEVIPVGKAQMRNYVPL